MRQACFLTLLGVLLLQLMLLSAAQDALQSNASSQTAAKQSINIADAADQSSGAESQKSTASSDYGSYADTVAKWRDVYELQEAAACQYSCYGSYDCPENRRCNVDYGIPCGGKFDGFCEGGGYWHADPIQVAALADLWFDAMLVAGQETDGRLHRKVLVELATKVRRIPLPDPVPQDIQNAVFQALDIVLGWDFRLPSRKASVKLATFVTSLTPAKTDLVLATKGGFDEAIKKNDPQAIVAPIEKFWREHPDFKPMHTGRCYPHGHPEVTDAKKCQTDELTRILSVSLHVGKVEKETASHHRGRLMLRDSLELDSHSRMRDGFHVCEPGD